MDLHANLSKPAFTHAATLPWQASPLPGVDRRMLDRIGDEVARATTIVRYAPKSYFSPHTHSGGEEFFVLEGTFSDEHGDYPQGTYVRNPVGSAHKPHSEEGCSILVKLQQMDPADQTFVRTQTQIQNWHTGAHPGVEVMPLHTYQTEDVALVRLASGARVENNAHAGGVEIFVLSGEVSHAGDTYTTHDWLRFPPGEAHTLASIQGAVLFVKQGHLEAHTEDRPTLLSV
ncbi:MAG: cupin domain-containing protein [Parvibaculaceae bacterium]|nr:cupin domain-containing protein [Parvibaculaceae bacterium]